MNYGKVPSEEKLKHGPSINFVQKFAFQGHQWYFYATRGEILLDKYSKVGVSIK